MNECNAIAAPLANKPSDPERGKVGELIERYVQDCAAAGLGELPTEKYVESVSETRQTDAELALHTVQLLMAVIRPGHGGEECPSEEG
jgi:hypothetical protein